MPITELRDMEKNSVDFWGDWNSKITIELSKIVNVFFIVEGKLHAETRLNNCSKRFESSDKWQTVQAT